MNIGSTLEAFRKNKKITQEEMAEAIDLSTSSISQIENNLKRPTKKNLQKMLDYLGLPEALLYVLSVEATDVPDGCVAKYDALWPQVEQLAIHVFKPVENFHAG